MTGRVKGDAVDRIGGLAGAEVLCIDLVHMDRRFEEIVRAAEVLRGRIGGMQPEVGIILGSGLGKLADRIEDAVTVPYGEVPGMPAATAIGHKGNFIAGRLGGKTVIAMQGRFHSYEGYPMQEVVFPVRIMKILGIGTLLVSNAAGGVNFDYRIGDLMIIRDHINLLPNPLIGPNFEDLGPRFPDMTRPYDLELIRKAEVIAKEEGISVRKGIYLACTGPTYETPAEYSFFRNIGADAVGMSTTPEVIAARHCGLAVFGISVITDEAHSNPDDYVTDENAILVAADAAADRMTVIFTKLIEKL